MSGPREEDGDYDREFFGGYERAADEAATRSFVTAIRKQTKAERERDEARAALARVRALHRARYATPSHETWGTNAECRECSHAHPCPTIRAIDGPTT